MYSNLVSVIGPNKKKNLTLTGKGAGIIALQLLMLSGLTGCGWLIGEDGYFRDRKHDYRQATVTEPMQVPEGADKTAIRPLYPIPGWDGAPQFAGDFEVPMPDAFVTKSQGEIRAFKSGNRYWITTNMPPARTWSKVRRFWELNGIDLVQEVPSRGDMETAWLARDKEGTKTRNKFKIKIEHGMHEGSSEVYIMHLGFAADEELPSAPELDWSQVKEDDPLAVAIMQELAGFLIDTEYEGAPASLLAQSFVGAPKSSLGTDAEGNRVLLLKLNFERAWEAVGKAIEDGAIEIADRNRSAGVYYVNYYPDAESGEGGGFFSFLPFVGNKDDKGQAYKFIVTLAKQAQQIQVSVAPDEAAVPGLSDTVLATIRDNLI